MHITIFGVGRSGTKAIQLYLAYYLALLEGKVWINYEPYLWIDRKKQNTNYKGFHLHKSEPIIIKSYSELSGNHRQFLNKLKHNEISTVTKFIRGNGRINAINEILQPDYSILVVRNLYEVLQSVLHNEWDFWSVGWEFRLDWDQFVFEIRESGLLKEVDYCLKHTHDRIDRNAFYWYAMNKAAIGLAQNNLIVIDYTNLHEIEDLAKNIFSSEIEIEPIKSKKFDGELLHYNYPLESFEKMNVSKSIISEFLLKTKLIPYLGIFFGSKIGSEVQLNKDYYLLEERKERSTRINIEKKEIFNFYQEDVMNDLNSLLSKRERLNISHRANS